MNKIDKTIRLIVALGIFYYFGFLEQSWWWLLAVPVLITAVYSFCPLYCFLKKGCPLRKD